MKNCIILGSGRSGTSMLAGTLARAGYFMGTRLYAGRDSNPKGFFESWQVNGVNEALLARVTPRRPLLFGRRRHRSRPGRAQRWLARVPVGTSIPCPPRLGRRIARLVRQTPFCFKDPRFCYTLPAWLPYLHDTVVLCIFRDPGVTARSIVKECDSAAYLANLAMDFPRALRVWTLMYRHVLETHRQETGWLFCHYDQILSGEAFGRIEHALKVTADRTFPERSLRRTTCDAPVPRSARRIYETLCTLAGYTEPEACDVSTAADERVVLAH